MGYGLYECVPRSFVAFAGGRASEQAYQQYLAVFQSSLGLLRQGFGLSVDDGVGSAAGVAAFRRALGCSGDGGVLAGEFEARRCGVCGISEVRDVGVGLGVCESRGDGVGNSEQSVDGGGVRESVSSVEGSSSVFLASGASVLGDGDGDHSGGSGCRVVPGKWQNKNRKKKLRQRAKRAGPAVCGSCGGSCGRSVGLCASLCAKWRAQNELSEFEAKAKLELLKLRDPKLEAARQRARALRDTETDKVRIEKAFSTLRATGNVPGVVPVGGYVEGTVVSETVSPGSSASMQEFRAVQKANADKDKEIADLNKVLSLLGDEAVRVAKEKACCKMTWTCDSRGVPPVVAEGGVLADGKFHMAYYEKCPPPNYVHKMYEDIDADLIE